MLCVERYTKTLKHVTIATMCRLMLPKILPEIDRVIYLDIDTIVHGPLRKMFEMDIPETGVTGRTSLSPNLINSWLRHDNIWPAIRYQSSKSFNAGVSWLICVCCVDRWTGRGSGVDVDRIASRACVLCG